MTDAPTPEDLEVHLAQPAEPDPHQIAAEVQKDLTLAGRLGGVKHRTDKVLVFLDEGASDALVKMENDVRIIQTRLDIASVEPDDETVEAMAARSKRIDAAQESLDELAPERERIRVAALKSALAIHMVAFPDVARDSAQRKMIAQFGQKGRIDPERAGEAADWLNEHLLGHTVIKVVDSDGASLTLPKRDEVGTMLRKALPSSQWKLLLGRFLVLATADSYSQAAQDDPGF